MWGIYFGKTPWLRRLWAHLQGEVHTFYSRFIVVVTEAILLSTTHVLTFWYYRHGLVLDHRTSSPTPVCRRSSSSSNNSSPTLLPVGVGCQQQQPRNRRRSADDFVQGRGFKSKRRSVPSTPSPTSAGPLFCFPGFATDDDAFCESDDHTWSEYTARRSVVKYRNRNSAKRSSRRSSRINASPSPLLQRVLREQYSVARSQGSQSSDRLMAVFYCWFFGWIYDVYHALSNNGRDGAFWKWTFSCLLVTSASLLVMALAGCLLYLALAAFTVLLRASLHFVTALTLFFVLILGMVSILSYSDWAAKLKKKDYWASRLFCDCF